METRDIPELPAEDLRWRVAGTPDGDWFWKSGASSIQGISSMLSVVGKSFRDFERALEFGCGCGRMLLHLEDVARTTQLYGVDIDAEAVAWSQAHVPWVKCSVNDGLPPLKFPDGHFDLLFNHSVFTHLNEEYQNAWLRELRRVVRPGGIVVLSVSGEHPFTEFLTGQRQNGRDPSRYLDEYRSKGIVFIEDDGWAGGPFPNFYHSTFHAPWYVLSHWSQYFRINAYVVRGALNYQDCVLLQRPEEDQPAEFLSPWSQLKQQVPDVHPTPDGHPAPAFSPPRECSPAPEGLRGTGLVQRIERQAWRIVGRLAQKAEAIANSRHCR